MAILNYDEMFFEPFEPKQPHRFQVSLDNVPAYMIKGMSAVNLQQGEVILNHINVQRKVKGKTTWGDVTMTLFDPITPSGAQTIMEWVRLSHESVTGRDGYSDFYKKRLELNVLGPVGDIVSQWVLVGAFIKDANFGDYSYDTENTAVNITMTVGMDYAILNY
jgi:hypothetical protein